MKLAAIPLGIVLAIAVATPAHAAPVAPASPVTPLTSAAAFFEHDTTDGCIRTHVGAATSEKKTREGTRRFTEVYADVTDLCTINPENGLPTLLASYSGEGPVSGSMPDVLLRKASFSGTFQITAWPSLQQIPMKANITWTGVGAIASDSSSGPVEGGGFQASYSSVRNARVAYTITVDGKRFSGTATGTMARGFLVTVVPPRHHGGKL